MPMEAFEEVADTFSDCEGCHDYFSSRMGSLNLSFTSNSYDPTFTFDTSSRSSSLRLCGSTSRSRAAEALPPAPPLLAVVSTSPCASMRRAVSVIRRTSLPNASGTDPSFFRPPWSPTCPGSGGSAATRTSVVDTGCPPPLAQNHRGSLKRRSCPEPDPADSQACELQSQPPSLEKPEAAGDPSSAEVLPPGSPGSPASSFASFAAALAAHYYADFGSVPDVPEHLEQVRQRTGKRQRMEPIEQLADG